MAVPSGPVRMRTWTTCAPLEAAPEPTSRRWRRANASAPASDRLRVGYNRVFGYFIEVPNAHRDRVPDDYSRKQTLAGAERYVTPDLKEHETIVLHARERAIAREQELLAGAAAMVAIEARSLADAAAAAATLDVAQSLATVAEEGHWVRPDDRHLVDARGSSAAATRWWSERSVAGRFVPNDVDLDDEARIIVLTGPNMAGKSTYLRQTATHRPACADRLVRPGRRSGDRRV